jgi:hypothetical protein
MKRLGLGIVLFLAVCICYAQTIPVEIMSSGTLSKSAMIDFLLRNNPRADRNRANDIIELYITEANAEGVNYEIAIAQMFFHTKYLSYNGTFVTASSNNFYGCISSDNTRAAHSFRSYQDGVRAHIQHLKGYASRDGLSNNTVDPRYQKIEEEYGWGSAPTVSGLSNRWAGADYASRINAVLSRMR